MFDNNKMVLKDKILLFTILLYVIYSVFPLMSVFLPVSPGVFNIFVSITIFALYPKVFLNKTFICFFLYGAVLGLYVLVGKQIPPLGIGDYEGKRIVIIELAFILPSLAIWSVLRYKNNYEFYKTISKITLFALFISFIYIIPLMFMYDNLLRSTVEGYYDYQVKGLPNYALVHAYVLLSPCFLFALNKLQGRKKRFVGTLMVLLSVLIVFSYVTAIIIILAGVIVFSIINSRAKKGTVVIWFLVLFVVLFVLYGVGVIDMLLDQVANFYEGTPTYSKVIEIKDSLHGRSGVSRSDLHRQSWYAFANDPVFGSMPVGGHSSLLDRLGGLGLLGFVPFIGMFIYIIKVESKRYSGKAIRYFYLTVLAAVILLYEKGLFGAEGWLFFLVLCPTCFTVFDNVDYMN